MTTLAATLLAPLASLHLTVTATTPVYGALRLFVSGRIPARQVLDQEFEGSGWQVEAAGWQCVDGAWGGYIIVREL